MKIYTKTKLSIILFTLSCLLLNGCSLKDISPQIVSIESIDLEDLRADSLILLAKINIENSNFFSITAGDINFKINQGNELLGTAIKKGPTELPANEIVTVDVKLNLVTEKAVALLSEMKDSVELNFAGVLDAKAFGFSLNQEINLPYIFPLKSNLEKLLTKESNKGNLVKVDKAELEKLGLSKSQVNVKFTLFNPYNIPIELLDYSSEIYINDSFSGYGNLKNKIELDKKEETEKGVFVFEGENIRTFLSTLKSIFSRKLEYRTEGDLLLKVLKYEIKIPFTNSGVLIQL